MSVCIEWERRFAVGIQEIDDEHRIMVDLINQAFLSSELMEASDATTDLLEKMQNYAAHHFATEEKFMVQFDYPAKEKHIGRHELFTARVNAAIARGQNGTDPYKVFSFLRDWFHGHVLEDDKELGVFLRTHGVA